MGKSWQVGKHQLDANEVFADHRLLQTSGVCSAATYKSTEPPVVSTLSELRSKQLISVLVSGDWTMFSLERRLHVRQAAIEPAKLDSPRLAFDHRKYRSCNFHCGKCATGSKHAGGGTNAWGQRANH